MHPLPLASRRGREGWPYAGAGQGSGSDGGVCGNVAAARNCPCEPLTISFRNLAGTRCTAASLGARGSGSRTTVALGAGGVWRRHCDLFSADHEPIAWVVAATAGVLCAAALLLRRHRLFPVAVMVAAMAAGFAVATVKTALVAHVVLTRPMYSPLLRGFVETREVRERTDRFVLRVVRMDDPWRHIKLDRVRLSVRKGTAPDVGSFVELKARLQPPLKRLPTSSYDVKVTLI